METNKTIHVKKGATLSLPCQIKSCQTGGPVNLTGSVIKADVAYLGRYVSSFTVDILEAETGKFNLTLDTTTLPLGTLNFDILRLVDGVVVYSSTVNLVVGQAITANE